MIYNLKAIDLIRALTNHFSIFAFRFILKEIIREKSRPQTSYMQPYQNTVLQSNPRKEDNEINK